MFQILSSFSKKFEEGDFCYQDNGHSSIKHFNHHGTTLIENVELSPTRSAQFNHQPIWASFIGSIGAVTIASQILQKSNLNESQVSALIIIIDSLDEITKLASETNLDLILDQPRQILELDYLVKKSYHLLCLINYAREAFEKEPLTGKQDEYLEYFSDTYDAMTNKFTELNKFCHRYNDDTTCNLRQLILNSPDLIGHNFIIDKSCDIEIEDPARTLHKLKLDDSLLGQILLLDVDKSTLYLKNLEKYVEHQKIDLKISSLSPK